MSVPIIAAAKIDLPASFCKWDFSDTSGGQRKVLHVSERRSLGRVQPSGPWNTQPSS